MNTISQPISMTHIKSSKYTNLEHKHIHKHKKSKEKPKKNKKKVVFKDDYLDIVEIENYKEYNHRLNLSDIVNNQKKSVWNKYNLTNSKEKIYLIDDKFLKKSLVYSICKYCSIF